MREVFEKIIEKLHKDARTLYSLDSFTPVGAWKREDAIEVVKEVATEYNNGWIPCSERLPEDLNDKNIDCFLVTDGFLIWMAYYNSEIGWQFAECTNSRNKIDWTEIIAWQPLPQPYTQKIERNHKNAKK